jgi:hypothetical protein
MAASNLDSLKKAAKQKIHTMWIFERSRTGVPGVPVFSRVRSDV